MSLRASFADGLSADFLANRVSMKELSLREKQLEMALCFQWTILLPRMIKFSPWKGGSKVAK